MHQNTERTGEKPGEARHQGYLCFPFHHAYAFRHRETRVFANDVRTASVAKFTLSQAIPHLVQLFLNPDEIQNRAPTSRLLTDLVSAAQTISITDADGSSTPLSLYKDEVLGVFTVGLKNTASCVHALSGLKGMTLTPHLLTDEELGFIVHNVNETLSKDENEEDEDIRQVVRCC